MKRIILLLFFCSITLSAQAQLHQNLSIGNPKSVALANAVTADPPGVDSLHYNPAGIHRAHQMIGHGNSQSNVMVEFQLLHTPTPELTFSSQWTGQYPDTNLNLNGCDASCFLENEEDFSTQSYTVETFTTYVPFSGPTESGGYAPKGGMIYNGDRFSFANGIYVTAASGYEMDRGSIGEFPRRSGSIINFVMSAPGFAYQVNDKLTVGISFPLNYGGLALNTSLRTPNLYISLASSLLSNLCAPPVNVEFCTAEGESLPLYDSLLEVDIDANDTITPSFNIGFLWDALPWLTFGGVYQGEVKHEFKGEFQVRYDEGFVALLETGLLQMVLSNAPETEVTEGYIEQGNVVIEQTLPAHISLGLSMKVMPGLKFNMDYKRTDFSGWDELVINYDRPTYIAALVGLLSGAAPNTSETPLGFGSGTNIATGIEYQYSDRWTFRFGYEFRDSVIPPENRNFTYPIADTRIWGLGTSIALTKGRRIEISAANIKTHQSIPAGTSYATTWDPGELYAAYPGYNLQTSLETNLFVFSWAQPW